MPLLIRGLSEGRLHQLAIAEVVEILLVLSQEFLEEKGMLLLVLGRTGLCSGAICCAREISKSPKGCWMLLRLVSGIHLGGPYGHDWALATDAQLACILLGPSNNA